MYMSKPYEDRVQVVLTDNGLGIENGKQASQVTQQINADIMRGKSISPTIPACREINIKSLLKR